MPACVSRTVSLSIPFRLSIPQGRQRYNFQPHTPTLGTTMHSITNGLYCHIQSICSITISKYWIYRHCK